MSIQMIGIDHSMAGVAIREQFSFTSAATVEALLQIRQIDGVAGCILLVTCNRTELWVSTKDTRKIDLANILCTIKCVDTATFAPYLRLLYDVQAVEYLFELTSGLRSRILGEDQILAQVKKAAADARAQEVTDNVLEVLFRSAVTASKKVKTEMILSTANASAVECAIARMQAQNLQFSGKRCLVIGNGEMGRRAANALTAQGAEVTVTVRQYRSGVVEIPNNCMRINYGDRFSILPSCDIIVSATSSPNLTLKYEDVVASGCKKDAIFLDLAVPHDIDPRIAMLDGLTLYDIDDFAVPQTEEMAHQLHQARAILADEEKKFYNWYECRDLVPITVELGEYFAQEVGWRMGSTVRALELPDGAQNILQNTLHDTSDKVLRKLLFAVRDQAGVDVFRACLTAMHTLMEDENV